MPRKPEPIAVEVPEGCKSSETGKTHRLFIEGGGAGRGREWQWPDGRPEQGCWALPYVWGSEAGTG